jgi:hypothetical protein
MFNKGKTATAAKVLFALLVTATPGLAGGSTTFSKTSSTQPTVQSTVVVGSVVNVTVGNPNRTTTVVLVTVTAVVAGQTAVSSAVLSVPPKSESTAQVGFSDPVGSVITVGLSEESNPF